MKKIFGIILTTALLSLAGCADAPAASSSGAAPSSKSRGLGGMVPDFVNEAYLRQSEDVMIGIGSYKTGGDPSKIGTGMTFAETRARASLARQLSAMIRDMVNDYTATSEIDPDAAVSFQETVTQALSRATLKGTSNSKYHPSGSSPQTKRIKASQFSWRKRQKMYLRALEKLSRRPARSRAAR